MQNMLWVASAIISQGAFYLLMQDATVSMVDTRDIAAVATIVLTTPGHVGKIYTITGPEALSFHADAEKLSTTLGKKVRYGDVSPEHFKRTLVQGGQPEWYADALNELFQGICEGQYAVMTHVVGKPPIAFDQFVQDYAPVFQGIGRQRVRCRIFSGTSIATDACAPHFLMRSSDLMAVQSLPAARLFLHDFARYP